MYADEKSNDMGAFYTFSLNILFTGYPRAIHATLSIMPTLRLSFEQQRFRKKIGVGLGSELAF